MAELNNSAISENNFLMNNSISSNEDNNFSISKPQAVNVSLNRSTNKMVNSPSSILSSRQEIFGREISKVQELMLQQEHACEAELEELERHLAEIEEQNIAMESRINELESKQSDQSEKKYEMIEQENKELTEKNSGLTSKNKELSVVIDEYQRSLARFKSQYDTEGQQLIEKKKVLAVERDIASQHVDTMEAEFNSIHQRYERCKNVAEYLKDNDKKIADLAHESSEKLRLMNILCQNLKEHATEKLEKCHNEMTGIIKNNRTEHAKMQAILQRMNLKCESQDEIILQNSNEIKETTKMCDRLIGKYNEHCGSSWY